MTADRSTLCGAAFEKGESLETRTHIRTEALGIDAGLLALAGADMWFAGVAHHIAGIAFTASWRRTTSILACGTTRGRAEEMLPGILISLPALAAVRLDAVAIDAAGRADGIADGVGAIPHAITLVAATASGTAFTATIDALLRAIRFTAATGPTLGIATITLADLRGNAVSGTAVLRADRFTDMRLCGTGSIAGKAATLVGRHTGAMDAGLPAAGHAVG